MRPAREAQCPLRRSRQRAGRAKRLQREHAADRAAAVERGAGTAQEFGAHQIGRRKLCPIDLSAKTVLGRNAVHDHEPTVVAEAGKGHAQLAVVGEHAVAAIAIEARQIAEHLIAGHRRQAHDGLLIQHRRGHGELMYSSEPVATRTVPMTGSALGVGEGVGLAVATAMTAANAATFMLGTLSALV